MLKCENANVVFVFVRLDDALTIPLIGIDGHVWGKHSEMFFSFFLFISCVSTLFKKNTVVQILIYYEMNYFHTIVKP